MGDGSDSKHHAHRLTVFSVAAGMVGVCLTGVGLVGVVKSVRGLETVVDELLTISALLFGCSAALYFSLLRRPDQADQLRRDHWADALFFLGLGLLLLACVVFAVGFESH